MTDKQSNKYTKYDLNPKPNPMIRRGICVLIGALVGVTLAYIFC